LKAQILQFDRLIMAWHRSSEASRRLDDIPGVGPALATALVATVADPRALRSGRNFSAWIGLVPKQHSSGARTGSAVSANEATAICASYLWPAHWPSSAMPRSMAPSTGPGSRHCWRGATPRSPPSHLPTRSPGWHGRSWPRASTIRNPSHLRRNEIAPDSRRDVKVGRTNST
jgi:hypothetical protein